MDCLCLQSVGAGTHACFCTAWCCTAGCRQVCMQHSGSCCSCRVRGHVGVSVTSGEGGVWQPCDSPRNVCDHCRCCFSDNSLVLTMLRSKLHGGCCPCSAAHIWHIPDGSNLLLLKSRYTPCERLGSCASCTHWQATLPWGLFVVVVISGIPALQASANRVACSGVPPPTELREVGCNSQAPVE